MVCKFVLVLISIWQSECCREIQIGPEFESLGKGELIGSYYIQDSALHNQRSIYMHEDREFIFSYNKNGGWEITKNSLAGQSSSMDYISGYLWDSTITCAAEDLTNQYTFYYYLPAQSSWPAIPDGSLTCATTMPETTPTVDITTVVTDSCHTTSGLGITCEGPHTCSGGALAVIDELAVDECDCNSYKCGKYKF